MRASALAFLAVTLVAGGAGRTVAQEPAPAKDPDDRLLQAELLEVSTGDLEKAKAVYQAIQADEKAPESTRARALLYLARCHRKLGEIDAAKKLLEDLVKTHARERDVLRQAQSFLRELSGGRAESPDFDWLKELERSPEIQSRVFDLAMDLVSLDTDAGKRARRQLLALGRIAVPVIERVIETTRDPRHRQSLAMVLLHSGRFEKLPLVLDPKVGAPPSEALEDLRGAIAGFNAEDRRRLIEAVAKLGDLDFMQPYAQWMRLWAGDTTDLAARLAKFESSYRDRQQLWRTDLFASLIAAHPPAAETLAERILDPKGPNGIRQFYFDVLLKHAPEKIEAAHWVALANATPVTLPPGIDMVPFQKYLTQLEDAGNFDVLSQLALQEDEGLRNAIVELFGNRYLIEPGEVLKASPRWATVLRKTRRPHGALDLQLLAEANDEAIPEFLGLLKHREAEAPEYAQLEIRRPDNWRPSPRYVEAMAGLLESKDAVTLRIVLDALYRVASDAPPAVAQAVEKLAGESPHMVVRGAAIQHLARRFSHHPEIGPQLARLYLAEYERRLKAEKPPDAPVKAPVRTGRPVLPRAVRARSPNPVGIGLQLSETVEAQLQALALTLSPLSLALYPHVLELADSELGAKFHEFFLIGGPREVLEPAIKLLIPKLETLKSRELRESLIKTVFWNRPIEDPELLPKLLSFLKGAAGDRSLSVEARLRAFLWPGEIAFEWLDWPQVFGSDDPLAMALLGSRKDQDSPTVDNVKMHKFLIEFWPWVKALPDDRESAIFQAALKSPEKLIRKLAVKAYPLENADAPEVFRLALEDRDEDVRDQVVARLKDASRADLAPLLTRLLKDPRKPVRLQAIEALKRYALPQTIEPLVALLDDPDVEIRNLSRAALKEIRQALEEKKQWEEVVKGLKPAPEKAQEKPKDL